MKKAVFIINSLQNGGAERVVVTQANYLQKKGVAVTIICIHRGIQYELHPEISVVYLCDDTEISGLSYFTRAVGLVRKLNRELGRIMKDGDVSLLTSNLLFTDLIVRLSGYSDKALYVLHAHQDIVPFSHSFLYKMFIRWLYGKRQVIGVSTSVADEMINVYHLKPDTVKTVLNPINFEEADRLKTEKADFPEPFILFCGRLTGVKHPERVIQAFCAGSFQEKYSLVILGIGELENELKTMAVSYGVGGKVYFRGWEKNVYKWMANADLLLLTSDTEGLSMAVIEALYCKCPVVSVKNRGTEGVMCGALKRYLCDSSVEGIVEKMKEALRSYPEILPNYTEPYSVDRNVKSYFELYKEWNDSSV